MSHDFGFGDFGSQATYLRREVLPWEIIRQFSGHLYDSVDRRRLHPEIDRAGGTLGSGGVARCSGAKTDEVGLFDYISLIRAIAGCQPSAE